MSFFNSNKFYLNFSASALKSAKLPSNVLLSNSYLAFYNKYNSFFCSSPLLPTF